MNQVNFYKCQGCQHILFGIGTVDNSCNGLELLTANTTDASQEKHTPEVHCQPGLLTVKVGSLAHPMTPEHLIEWVFLQTKTGAIFHNFSPTDQPEVQFAIDPATVISVYGYCNLHGLWKANPHTVNGAADDLVCSPEFPGGCVDVEQGF